jgi:hypothetical protein
MTVFWDVSLCSLVEVYQRFRGAYCLHHQGALIIISLILEAASTCEILVNFYQTTQQNIPEDSHLHTYRREKLESHNLISNEMFPRYGKERMKKIC